MIDHRLIQNHLTKVTIYQPLALAKMLKTAQWPVTTSAIAVSVFINRCSRPTSLNGSA